MFVGREQMLSSIRSGLATGPSDTRFISLLMGPLGSGKTVMLDTIERIALNAGWLVLSVDASTSGIQERIKEQIEWAQEAYEEMPEVVERTRQTEVSAGLNLWPLTFQRKASESLKTKWSLRRQLTTLGRHAHEQETAVLLSIDEFHGGDREELRRVAADLQHMTKREELPVAFMGAGLSDMKHTLLEDKKMTFFHRIARFDMPPLSVSESMFCLKKTIQDAGGTFDASALRMLAEASGALPYRMQLLGYHAWVISGAPFSPMDEHAATEAIVETDRAMAERVYTPTWHELGNPEQAYLRAMADLGEPVNRRCIAERTGRSASDLANIERRLKNIGCIRETNDQFLTFGDIMKIEVVRDVVAAASRYESATDQVGSLHSVGPTLRTRNKQPRCNSCIDHGPC